MVFSLQLPGLPGLGEGPKNDPTAITPEELERRRRLAMALTQQATDASPVQHWTQALARGLQGALGGYQQSQAASQESAARRAATEQFNALFGAGMLGQDPGAAQPQPVSYGSSAPQSYAAPQSQGYQPNYAPSSQQAAAPASSAIDPESGFPAAPTLPQQANAGGYAGPSTQEVVASYAAKGRRPPAAIRANNPGAMWPSASSAKFGSKRYEMLNDGLGQGNRIAYFDTPEQGAAAQFDLLERKYTGKTLAGALRMWTGGNSSDSYAAEVSRQTGIPVNATLTPEMIRDPRVAIPIARTMAKIEAGREYPMAPGQWAAAHQMYREGGGAAPSAMPPQEAGAAPVRVASNGPVEMPQQAAAPPQDRRAQLAQLLSNPATSQWLTPAQQQLALQALKPQEYSYQTTPDGTILRMDPRGGPPQPVYSAPKPPQYTKIGQDQYGNDQYGFVDPVKQTVTPATQPSPALSAAGVPSAIAPPPPGVDPKVWRTEETKRLAKDSAPPDAQETTSLRKEVQNLPSYKNWAQAKPVYDAMYEAAGRDTRAADLNMIYGVGKIMDPGSVVREGEMIMVQNAQSLPAWVTDLISRANQGGRLTPDLRAKLMQEAHGRMQAYEGQINADLEQYKGIASRRGMNEADVLPNVRPTQAWKPQPKGVGAPAAPQAVAPQAVAPPAAGHIEDGYRFKGGDPANPASWEKASTPKYLSPNAPRRTQ